MYYIVLKQPWIYVGLVKSSVYVFVHVFLFVSVSIQAV